jgi:hypothetical protein
MAVNEFEEFRKQYDHTFVRIKFEDKSDYISAIIKLCSNDDPKNPYIVAYYPKIGNITINWNASKQNIDYSFPLTGLFNADSCFFMFHRYPERQWKRGITGTNSSISDPLRDIKLSFPELRATVPKLIALTSDLLDHAFVRVFPNDLQMACTMLQSPKMQGIALNPVFGLTLNHATDKDDEYILWKHLSMIGTVDVKSKTITVKEPVFYQEVMDFLKRNREVDWLLQ